MAITTNTQSNAQSVVNHAVGQVISDAGAAAALTISCGFKPRVVRWVNVTSSAALLKDEWYEGMAANSSIHSVGSTGVVTLNTTLGPSVTDGSFTMPAGSVAASSTFAWEAIG